MPLVTHIPKELGDMKNQIIFLFLIFCFCSVKSQTIDSVQIAGLCKVWGLIKYYHPDITKNKMDWDKVLIDNYPTFAQKNDFELFNKNIGRLIDLLNKKDYHLKVDNTIFDAIVKDRIEEIENFKYLSDTNKFINRISFSWINDSIFSKEIQYKLCEILLNYKPYKSKHLKGKIVVKHIENKYLELDSITEPYRILGLFRYWNTINYFFPYKHLSDNNWDSVLTEAIPNFIQANNYIKYIQQVKSLSSKINDSHGFYRFSTTKYYKTGNANIEKKGYVPYNFKLIDSNVVVSDLLVDSTALKLGDIVLKIDTTNLIDLRNLLKKYKSHSSIQAEESYYKTVLANTFNSQFNFTIIRDEDTVLLTETKIVTKEVKVESNYRKPPFYYSIDNNSGYIELTQIKFGELEKALKEFKNKKSIVFDVRGYPETIAWIALPHLLKNHSEKVATYYYPNKKYPGTFINNPNGENYRIWFVKPFLFLRKQYKGKIVVLINASAISQAETVCMMFKAYSDNVTFIGQPTTGANGDISSIDMPGGISSNFTSLDWHFPNNTQLQRIGIIPDILVKETIDGIKLSKDEILEKAIQFINNQDN